MNNLKNHYKKMFESIKESTLEMQPSKWVESHRILTRDVSTLPGPFKYDNTPYMREIIDTMSPYHPARIVGLMFGSQAGKTEGLIINGICWMIANNPGNCFMLSADEKLNSEAIESKLDQGIQSCGIRHLIGPNVIRKRNQRTGDTSTSKEYVGGRLFGGGLRSIDRLSRQRSVEIGFFDDWDSAPISDKAQGSLFDLLQTRFKTAAKTMKQYYISTPETRPSNIEQVYLRGDQRQWKVPCPKCGSMITIEWTVEKEGHNFGIYFEKDKSEHLIKKSVGYICQECGEFFTEKYKYEMNLAGIWEPTAQPYRDGYFSYHLNNLMGAPTWYGWTDYVYQWIEIFDGGVVKKSKLKPFKNQVLGEPWEESTTDIDRVKISRNTRDYNVGIVPILQSKEDGNGEIFFLTCAADLNGNLDDARLDYDVWAHTETGSIYSITQGSIGSYQPKSDPDKRFDKKSYRFEVPNNVWDILWNEVINVAYETDTGETRRIFMCGIDTGHFPGLVYQFLDQHPLRVVGLRGKGAKEYSKINANASLYKIGQERSDVFFLESNRIKDNLEEMMLTTWKEGTVQPPGFMNFPFPEEDKYTKHYFRQYYGEHKVLKENDFGDPIGWFWDKRSGSSQNHFWDTAYYNLALRDIIKDKLLKEAKQPKGLWSDFVRLMKPLFVNSK